jgi:PAS domain-containing protein
MSDAVSPSATRHFALELFGHNISIGYDNPKMWPQVEDVNLLLERRVAERTLPLTQSEADLRRCKPAVEHSSASILIADVQGIITYANPALVETSQYGLDEPPGNRASLFKSGTMPDHLLATLREEIRAGRRWTRCPAGPTARSILPKDTAATAFRRPERQRLTNRTVRAALSSAQQRHDSPGNI